MGMKILIEVEVNYPDLSMQKHVDMLRAVFKQNKVYGVKTVKLVKEARYIPINTEQIYPQQCFYCNGSGCASGDGNGRSIDCDYCEGTGKKE